ncbi:multiple epidermal growth factor-like domains protein 10 [Biomphalaria glabrata]|uniref:Multiple epidermal growth factor-like domains protein 10 n=1 Tax=Biomphalaria glabrata TaxID=6526 RepID=A0A9W3ABE0_BIOGL|nr:multiple epidermal growth factor-like domains protein 10 [Biomphalaria glabrata]
MALHSNALSFLVCLVYFQVSISQEDLTVLDNTILSPSNNLLTDKDDETCLSQSVQTITVTFNRTYVFTWLRLAVKDPLLLPGFSVQFSRTTSTSIKIECLNQKYFLVDNSTLDIQCDQPEAIQTVIITGTGQTSLCSLYINGGRNVALKQSTSQTTTYSDKYGTFDASKGVDGNTSANFYRGLSCTHTDIYDPNPMWTVTFPLSEITRYILYNRDDENQNRLARFILVGENSGSQRFSFNDTSTTALLVYVVLDAAKSNITQVKINATEFLTLCEVEIYGVCYETTYGQNCSKTCSKNCTNQKCDPVNGKCNVCIPGFTGDFCNQICAETNFGQNCSQICSRQCANQTCHHANGSCKLCYPGYIGDYCNQTCPPGRFGQNCSEVCDSNCNNSLACDNINGYCYNGCKVGYSGNQCNEECKTGKWGRNCVNECSSQCRDQSCDRVTGRCEYICDSLTNLSCPSDCPSGYHGSNCTLKCSSTCKDQLCNRIGYCITCLPAHTGLYCENASVCLASENETSGLTFSSSVGIGVAVGAVVIILIDVVIVIICRTRLTALSNKSQEDLKHGTRQQTYDTVKQMNEYNHSYELSRSNFEVQENHDQKRNESSQYENASTTIYETIS